jgi:serine/threonine-protein kinase RsbW
MAKKVIPAKLENLEEAINFIKEGARSLGFDDRKISQIQLASEEVLVNIINYAYAGKDGNIEITYTPKNSKALEIEIVDWGIPFNLLEQPSPDISAPIENRKIGGLGIYLVRNTMDEVNYKRYEDRNSLTLIKYL